MSWGFPKIRGTFLGVLIIRIIVYWGLYWGPLILGNYHLGFRVSCSNAAVETPPQTRCASTGWERRPSLGNPKP